MAQTITLTTPIGQNSYPIWIVNGSLMNVGQYIQQHFPKAEKILLVTEQTLQPLFADQVKKNLESSGFIVWMSCLQGGEDAKTQQSLQTLYDVLLEQEFTRHDIAIALGGGIIGDITGYAAATYRRGIPFIQLPTTLLAQVDASVGGKVAINYGHYKNMIGTFYQPAWVCIDPAVLHSLPPTEFACGMAEIIKYAFIQKSIPKGQKLSLLRQTRLKPLVFARYLTLAILLGMLLKHCQVIKYHMARPLQ